ncbi:putative peripheral membrane protein required for the formation of cytosolic vesicles [Serpula lacrymans var. lacrymans S7.3]|uniref:Autophagy-related protein 2 n=2 Tax=Serpula lacrymans var. lacrymans TaxID=341189 RepID=F8QEK4_SERL3|nr:uncharacterized protein SERLADRAFT_454231 [Serpula lacrymans var. lacrymans S7.9]EGN93260.1 putative peripheral membrane protein required for the formation of cytosolic vesicles [Serpula lacrymans var. lacrymans S7.3]EGO18643.1 hypothetical protein SERLADRAFT_454231 [Serpula lacrymans var. lacrymans S7.9]
MSSWYPSWFSSLPSLDFSLPSSIQSRFIAFVLKKSLGRFLKPGQLDAYQIDSQIGSGYVNVKDLELDTPAINTLFSGLPISAHDGSIGCITARIPWPKPLTSTVGCSIQSLHVTLHVTPPTSTPPSPPSNTLTESVVSVAEAFVQDELSVREESIILESIHSNASPLDADDDQQNIPGGLNPFINDANVGVEHGDVDPAGVSLFATIIERLLARFEFDAVDTKITLVHPGHASFTLSIAEIRYHTEPHNNGIRSVSIHGVSVSCRNLRPTLSPIPTPSTLSPTSPISIRHASPTSSLIHTPEPVSPVSSSSSLDEDTTFLMSQSLATLPPRPVSGSSSPTSSVASSIYHSTLTMTHDLSRTRTSLSPDTPPRIHTSQPEASNDTSRHILTSAQQERRQESYLDEIILSFGREPIVVRVTTPVSQPSDCPEGTESESEPSLPELIPKGVLNISVSSGVVACAFRAYHIRVLLDVLEICGQHSPRSAPTSASSNSGSAQIGLDLESTLEVKGVVILLLPDPTAKRHNDSSDVQSSLRHFFTSPLVPPDLRHGYVRAHLDGIFGSVVLNSQNQSTSLVPTTSPDQENLHSTIPQPAVSCRLMLSSLSIFSFQANSLPDKQDSALRALPILITDPGLPGQYSVSRWQSYLQKLFASTSQTGDTEPLAFDVLDWTSPQQWTKSADISTWRTTSVGSDCSEKEEAPVHPAFLLSYQKPFPPSPKHPEAGLSSTDKPMVLKVSPLHFFIDLGSMLGNGDMLLFLNEVTSSNVHKSSQIEHKPSLVLEIPMIRVQVRCPPPPLRSARSGAFVVDIHGIRMSTLFVSPTGPAAQQRDIAPGSSDDQKRSMRQHLLDVKCQGVTLAYSDVNESSAALFLLLGSMSSHKEVAPGNEGSMSHSSLRVNLSHLANSSSSSVTYLNVDVASTNAIITKAVFDGLQRWADDAAQLMERTGKPTAVDIGKPSEVASSRSISGAKPISAGSETHVQLVVSQAFVRLMLPRREDDAYISRPLDLFASNVSALLEMKTGSEDGPTTIVKITDLSVMDFAAESPRIPLLSLAAPRNSLSTTKRMIEVRFNSSSIPGSTAKASNIKLSLWGFNFRLLSKLKWLSELERFAKAPPGVFESVVPSERTHVSVKIMESSLHAFAPGHPGAAVLYIGETTLSLDLINKSSELSLKMLVPSISVLLIDALPDEVPDESSKLQARGVAFWKESGYALIAELVNLDFAYKGRNAPAPLDTQMLINRAALRIHICADTLAALTGFIGDFSSAFKSPPDPTNAPTSTKGPSIVTDPSSPKSDMIYVEEHAFTRNPEVGSAPDMISDDLPTNLDYLDVSFGTAAGFRELQDDDLDDFDVEEKFVPVTPSPGHRTGTVSDIGGETIRILRPFKVIENYYDTIPPEPASGESDFGEAMMRIRIYDCDVTLSLYDGYDWSRTRELLEKEIKEMRRRLAKIRQLVATGQVQDSTEVETSALMFNSVYIGLQADVSDLEPGALVAAIDEELDHDTESDIESSWQSLHPASSPGHPPPLLSRVQHKRLTRSDGSCIDIRLLGLDAEIDNYRPGQTLVSRILATVRDVEILDHIKSSTWRHFLCELRSDSQGNVRETGSNMVRVEIQNVRPIPSHPAQEARLRAKLLPLRLYVDQDALDFLKNFFSFKDSESPAANVDEPEGTEAYIQHAEIFPVDIKLDYKPRRVDYRALREGKTIELMNFFHFDGAEMTLRHLNLYGINGWPRLFEKLNDLWTPDVKATQLVDVISGVSPIRSVVNVGSGVADLVLLPITQYKKDGRIIRGVQKGTTAFVKSTAMEAIKLGAQLATGTQVILEQAENVLGGQFHDPITAETVQFSSVIEGLSEEDELPPDLFSKYAEQPEGITEGVRSAYRSMHRNLNSAAQTILAVPMEVYERSGNEGAMRAVIRAVPIAVLKPMIGASEAVSKTLMGLHNTLDPNVRYENEAKYKQR